MQIPKRELIGYRVVKKKVQEDLIKFGLHTEGTTTKLRTDLVHAYQSILEIQTF